MANNNQKSGGGSIVLTIIIVILLLGGIGSCSGGGNSNDNESKTCQVCHKTFTNSDDVHSIVMRNMCENCYSNFEYTQDLKEELERYDN